MYFHYIAKLCSPMIINKKWERLLKELEHLLKELPSKLQVEFALYCAKDVQHLAREKDKAIIGNAIRVTELWLIGKATTDECLAASSAASHAAYVSYIGYATLYASEAYEAAFDAAYAAAYAASLNAVHAASYASYAAAYAASAASCASYSVAYDKKLLKYLNYLKEMIQSMPEVERLLLGVNI